MYIKKKTLNESAKKKTKGKIKHKSEISVHVCVVCPTHSLVYIEENQTILWIATDGSVEGNKKQ